MRQTDLQRLFAERGIRPNKKLGQCFLVDDNLARWIVDQIAPGSGDTVVEAGPGAGALSVHLAGKVRRLVLVEKDAKLAARLAELHGSGASGVEVVHGDAADHDIRPLFLEGEVKFIGNLPYSVGTEILRNFLSPPSPVSVAVVMLQREVALRLCAAPRSKDWGLLSLMIQSRWRPELLKTVGPQPFYPRPDVESSIVRLVPRPPGELPACCPQAFQSLARRGFSQRRKQLRNNLGIPADAWETAAEALGLPLTARAEELPVETWMELSNLLEPHPAGRHAQSGEEIFDVVDEQDAVTGQATRAEVHARGLRHRAVHVLLRHPVSGEIFLQKRSAAKDSHPLKWDSSASGHLDSGEGYADAALRELEEELFLSPGKPLERLAKIAAGAGTDMEFVEVYLAESKGRGIRWHGHEIDAGAFFPVDLVRRWIEARPGDFATGFRTCFAAVADRL